MPAIKQTSMDKKYQAQDDAYTLARAQEIQADKARVAAAKKEAKVMAKQEQVESQKRIQTLNKVAKIAPKEAPKKAETKQVARAKVTKRK